ncbi:MAG TPA: PilN domain-containing protein [Patescibacteria group bacterium]|nr:PilN domain-containing protein [Patescibacteria group bacterium]
MSQSINLIPQEEKQEQTKTQLVKMSTLFAIFFLVIVGLVSFYYFYQVSSVKTRIKEHESNIERLRGEIANLSSIEITARNLDTRYQALTSIYISRVYYSLLLEEVLKHVPEVITIVDFTINTGNKITLTGESDNYIAISEFVTNLSKDDKIFKNVTLNSVSLESRANSISFFVSVEFIPEALKK